MCVFCFFKNHKHMTRYLALLLLCACSFLFMGCPYSSEVPIDSPSMRIDERMLGKWESKSSSDYTYTVTKTDAYKYKIDKKSASSGDVTTYIGFLSKVDDVTYMNLYEDGSTTPTYYFYKVQFSSSGAKVSFASVTENITEKFESSSSLRQFFRDNQKNSYFFDKDVDEYIKD